MAKLKAGKLHGRIGNTVHRVWRGEEIVQSYPRTLKPKGKTLIENNLFGECSRMNSKIYRLIKDFALNMVDYTFSWQLMALLKMHFFQREGVKGLVAKEDWLRLEAADNFPVNKNVPLSKVLLDMPAVELAQERLLLHLPEQLSIDRSLLMSDVHSMEYSVTLIHYDFHLKLAEVVAVENSGRKMLTEGVAERLMEFDLVNDEREVRDGLLIACFGLRFFSSSLSYAPVNSLEVNPVGILGMWWKDGGRSH